MDCGSQRKYGSEWQMAARGRRVRKAVEMQFCARRTWPRYSKVPGEKVCALNISPPKSGVIMLMFRMRENTNSFSPGSGKIPLSHVRDVRGEHTSPWSDAVRSILLAVEMRNVLGRSQDDLMNTDVWNVARFASGDQYGFFSMVFGNTSVFHVVTATN